MSPISVVLLDRDGVINTSPRGYVRSADAFTLLPGAAEALGLLTGAGYRLFLVSNQSTVGYGLVEPATLEAINAKLCAEVAAAGGRFAAMYYCVHTPRELCECRKPRPGLLRRAAAEHGFAPRDAVLVGDSDSDIEAARAFGCRAVLVRTGRGEKTWRQCAESGIWPDEIHDDLMAVARSLVAGAPGEPCARSFREGGVS